MNTLPDTPLLSRELSSLLLKNGHSDGPVTILSREPFMLSSTFPAEIITCRLNDGQVLQLFGKYLAGVDHNHFGHRGGVEYESAIYAHMLSRLPLTLPKFYGSCSFEGPDETLLVLEFLNESERLHKAASSDELIADAAAWAGQLHRMMEGMEHPFVKRYDEAYYKLWIEKVENLLPALKQDYPWMAAICSYFREKLPLLLNDAPTLIHGEYYPMNILVRDNLVYPIDWETAAYGPGIIDLASLLEGWNDTVRQNAIARYRSARWPNRNGSPDHFEELLLLSRIYFQLRWLSEYSTYWLKTPKEFTVLYQLSKQAASI